jgi:predicted PurR-regulated permease PerM
MNDQTPSPAEVTHHAGKWSHERTQSLVLFCATAIAVVLCYALVHPFLPAFAWAVALAVVAHPLHVRMLRLIRYRTLAAVLSVTVVVVALVVPALFIVNELTRELSALSAKLTDEWTSGKWQAFLAGHPEVASFLDSLQIHFNPADARAKAANAAMGSSGLPGFVTHGIEIAVQTLIAFFLLFYFFIQGTLGGLMFWWLGLPSPLLWGVVMGMLAIVPVLGAFVVWVPAAIYLALSGDVGKAVILTIWGAVVIGFIDNLLYPLFVGQRARLHTVPVFIAIMGGLAMFGSAGMIVGPVILVFTVGLLHAWRERMDRESQPRIPEH